MKAIRIHNFGPPEVMRLEEVPDLVSGPSQVVVTVKAAGSTRWILISVPVCISLP